MDDICWAKCLRKWGIEWDVDYFFFCPGVYIECGKQAPGNNPASSSPVYLSYLHWHTFGPKVWLDFWVSLPPASCHLPCHEDQSHTVKACTSFVNHQLLLFFMSLHFSKFSNFVKLYLPRSGWYSICLLSGAACPTHRRRTPLIPCSGSNLTEKESAELLFLSLKCKVI